MTSKFVVYHVPKGDRKNGTDLSGWEGVVDSRADDLNGVYISANLEVKVKFDVPNDPKGKTFIVHCKEDELEAQPGGRRCEQVRWSGRKDALSRCLDESYD